VLSSEEMAPVRICTLADERPIEGRSGNGRQPPPDLLSQNTDVRLAQEGHVIARHTFESTPPESGLPNP